MDFRFLNNDNKDNVDQNAKELKRRPMPSFLTHNQDNTHMYKVAGDTIQFFLFSSSDPRTDTMQQNGAAAVPQAPSISVQRSHVSSAIQDVR